jgi:hypothetical protein
MNWDGKRGKDETRHRMAHNRECGSMQDRRRQLETPSPLSNSAGTEGGILVRIREVLVLLTFGDATRNVAQAANMVENPWVSVEHQRIKPLEARGDQVKGKKKKKPHEHQVLPSTTMGKCPLS